MRLPRLLCLGPRGAHLQDPHHLHSPLIHRDDVVWFTECSDTNIGPYFEGSFKRIENAMFLREGGLTTRYGVVRSGDRNHYEVLGVAIGGWERS